jgi:hypothetical protein
MRPLRRARRCSRDLTAFSIFRTTSWAITFSSSARTRCRSSPRYRLHDRPQCVVDRLARFKHSRNIRLKQDDDRLCPHPAREAVRSSFRIVKPILTPHVF